MALLCIFEAHSAERNITRQSNPLSDWLLVGISSSNSLINHAIIIIGGEEHLFSVREFIDNDWRLIEVHLKYVLLIDASGNRMKLNLRQGRSSRSSRFRQTPELQTTQFQPIEVHTVATHFDLQPGQTRQFFTLPKTPDLPEESGQTSAEIAALEAIDHGMTQEFSSTPVPEVLTSEGELLTNNRNEPDSGQSITFGLVPTALEYPLE
jgi:hypothetical protein